MDQRSPRDGKVLEELGTYDPMIADVDARAVLVGDRISYWLGVGAQPSENVKTLIKKYGEGGTHLDQQKVALEQLAQPKVIADPGTPASLPKKQEEAAAEPVTEAPAAEAPAAETPPAEAPAAEEKPADAPVEATAEESSGEAEAAKEAATEETASEKTTEEPTSE